MTTRIYIVKSDNEITALVRASTQAQAVNHVVRGTYSASVASVEDMVRLLPAWTVVDAAEGEFSK